MSRPDEEIYGKTADQILRSDMFGLNTTRAPAFHAKLNELARQAMDGNRTAALTFMRQAARGSGAAEAVDGDPVADMPAWLKARSS